MKKNDSPSEAYAELVCQVKYLTDQIYLLRKRITDITDRLSDLDKNLGMLEKGNTPKSGADTAGPGNDMVTAVSSNHRNTEDRVYAANTFVKKSYHKKDTNIISFTGPLLSKPSNMENGNAKGTEPYIAEPGKPISPDIFDYRPMLQRDGLILLGWDKRFTEKGEFYTAYWVTSAGVPRYYASRLHAKNDFQLAQPHHKSYAAEDGIEYYGQKAPSYIVHAAPELMMSNPKHKELREVHINTLKKHGFRTDFSFKFLLTKEKQLRITKRKPAVCSEKHSG